MDLLTHKSCLFDFSAYQKLSLAASQCEDFFSLLFWELGAASYSFFDAFNNMKDVK